MERQKAKEEVSQFLRELIGHDSNKNKMMRRHT